jgi:hypothetical protein
MFTMSIGDDLSGRRGPDLLMTLIGAGIIVGSGLYAFARERARKRASQGA